MTDRIGASNPGHGNFMAPLVAAPIQLPLHNGAAGDGTQGNGGGAAGAGGENQPGAGGDGDAAAKAAADAAAAKAQEKVYSFKEDRSDWVPRTRLNEVSGQSKAEIERLKKELEQEQKRVRAAFGIDTPKPEEAEEAEVTEKLVALLSKKYPGLKALETLTQEQLQEVLEAGQAAKATTERTWQRHAEEMVGAVEAGVAKGLGLEKLSERQRRQVQRAYREEAALALQARESGSDASNDFLARHERGDKSLVTEFVKEYLADWVEPVKRSVTAQQARQFRPTPRGERARSMPTTGAPQVNLSNDSDFKKALLAARSGGQD